MSQFYGKAAQAATRILEAFQSGSLPKALAPVFVRRKDNVPCRAWSWSNQLLATLYGHSDARGYRQWESVAVIFFVTGARIEKDFSPFLT